MKGEPHMDNREVQPSREDSRTGGAGTLYVVATPIGNLEDMTFRGVRVLQEAEWIACEDPRRTLQLLNHYQIKNRLISYHEHNEETRAVELVKRLESGVTGALVTDAGMPLVSDPGYRLVRLAIDPGVRVTPIPGPSAVPAALAVSGLAVDEFHFIGFLPAARQSRRQTLARLRAMGTTVVFFEAPHRLRACLEDVEELFGDASLVIGREMTKLHEEFLRGSARHLLDHLPESGVKGEITVVLGAAAPDKLEASGETLGDEIRRIMAEQGLEERAALKMAARGRGMNRGEAYRLWQTEKVRSG